MAEYIEKEPLLKKAKELQGGSFSSPLIVEAIEKAPTIEIVRCKDCEHFYRVGDVRICRYWNYHATKDDAYCSYGERRSDERN